MKAFQVAVLGASGMVGQRFVSLLAEHPWFQLRCVAASPRSAGQRYGERMAGCWCLEEPLPPSAAQLTLLDASADAAAIAQQVDFVFSALDLPAADCRQLEEQYAHLDCPVISNCSACRQLPDVPLLLPECNLQHTAVLPQQRRRLGCKRGFIVTKPNCSLQSYVPALEPLRSFGLRRILVVSCQALSGAGKTAETWPEMADNLIPLIPGEEEKSQSEPLKIWGSLAKEGLRPATEPQITAQCLRVPISNGHFASVFVDFEQKPSRQEILQAWERFSPLPPELPSAPQPPLHYCSQPDRPQPRFDRLRQKGMQISLGRLQENRQYQWNFVALSHNTLRGAAGGAVLAAEALVKEGWLSPKNGSFSIPKAGSSEKPNENHRREG